MGIGLYTVPDAARLTSVAEPRIRRWLTGHTYRSGDRTAVSPAIWRPQVPTLDGVLSLGFLDLMEIRFVNAFLEARVSWPKIKLCAERARELFGQNHPFATRRFRTDGCTIFAEVMTSGERRAGLLGFFLGPQWEGQKHVAKAAMLLRWWPKIESQAQLVRAPAAFEVPFRWGSGQFRQLKG